MEKGERGVIVSFGIIGAILAVIALLVKSVVAKWILGVLAALVIGLTIYMLVESIVKHKRRPKDIDELFLGAMKEAASRPDFAQRMEAAGKRRDVLYDGQRTDDPEYGFTKTNPIMTSSVSSSNEYLKKLRTIEGLSFTWNRTGSFCIADLHGIEGVMVDEYQLFLNGEEFQKIYICPYGHSSSFTPQGMVLSDT